MCDVSRDVCSYAMVNSNCCGSDDLSIRARGDSSIDCVLAFVVFIAIVAWRDACEAVMDCMASCGS